jgi:F0F1-type ATP synthase assembly protein I
MGINLDKFVHTERGKIIMSILLGFGLASLFRNVCKDKNCLIFHAAPLVDIKDKIYKSNGKCMKFVPVASKCSLNAKTVTFE